MEKQHRIRTEDRVIVRVSGKHGKVRVKYRIKINQNKKAARRRRISRRENGDKKKDKKEKKHKKEKRKSVSVDTGEGNKSNVSDEEKNGRNK